MSWFAQRRGVNLFFLSLRRETSSGGKSKRFTAAKGDNEGKKNWFNCHRLKLLGGSSPPTPSVRVGIGREEIAFHPPSTRRPKVCQHAVDDWKRPKL